MPQVRTTRPFGLVVVFTPADENKILQSALLTFLFNTSAAQPSHNADTLGGLSAGLGMYTYQTTIITEAVNLNLFISHQQSQELLVWPLLIALLVPRAVSPF